jgi:hypothetical protein
MSPSFADVESMGAVTIALIGQLNPMILQPHWLLANGLIDEDDYQHLVGQDDKHRFVVSAEFAGLRLPWAKVEATREACTLMSELATDTPDRIRELAVGIFERLPHTPIDRFAIVHTRHFALPSDAWEALAERLAPSAPLEAVVEAPRFHSVEHVVKRGDGNLSILVEPSIREGFTAYIAVEDEIESPDDAGTAAHRALRELDSRWDAIRLHAEAIMRCLVVE